MPVSMMGVFLPTIVQATPYMPSFASRPLSRLPEVDLMYSASGLQSAARALASPLS